MGYYAVGMHLVGIAKWLSDICKRRNINHISFLARDGYLPKMAFELLSAYNNAENISASYVPCSRKCLLPWIVENEYGLYALPLNFKCHTPVTAAKQIAAYLAEQTEEALTERIKRAGFDPTVKFTNQKQYLGFINWVKENLFDKTLLEEEKKKVARFYRERIPEESLVFDLGYSGRILSGLQKALGYSVTFSYLHEDNKDFAMFCRRDNLDVEVMYDFFPPVSDFVREYFLSETGRNCEGVKEENGKIIPVYTNVDVHSDERFASGKIEDGARCFITDFIAAFSSVKTLLSFYPNMVSLPFEGLLQISSPLDRNALTAASSEDNLYGNHDNISVAEFWKKQTAGEQPAQVLSHLLKGKGRISKMIVYWICDRRAFKGKVKYKLASLPVFQHGLRKTYSILKRIWHKVKG